MHRASLSDLSVTTREEVFILQQSILPSLADLALRKELSLKTVRALNKASRHISVFSSERHLHGWMGWIRKIFVPCDDSVWRSFESPFCLANTVFPTFGSSSLLPTLLRLDLPQLLVTSRGQRLSSDLTRPPPLWRLCFNSGLCPKIGHLPLKGVGGYRRVDLSFCVFPCFAVFGGPKIPKCWEKQHEKCHCHTPFVCPKC